MRKFLFLLILLSGVGYAAYYFYKNDNSVKDNIDKFISRFYSGDTIRIDTLAVQNNKEIYNKSKVKPKSIKYTKKVIKSGPFKELDDYAKNTPSKYENNIDELVSYIIEPAKTDYEKVRLIYSWIAFHIKYDAQGYNTGNYGDLSPEGVLRSKVAVCEGYSALFQELISKAGLVGEKVIGFAKGFGYVDGEEFTKTDHAWNVVKLNGKWKLFDVTWGSGYGKSENNKLVSYSEFDDYWFDTNPNEFIFSHLPEDSKWQFNKPVLTLKQYERLPYVEKDFFKLGFNADYALENSLNRNIDNFVDSYSLDYPIDIISVPYKQELNNEMLNIKIKSDYAEEIVAINNGTWNYFKKDGDVFYLTFKPEIGKLKISAKFNIDDSNYSSFLIYDVKEEKN